MRSLVRTLAPALGLALLLPAACGPAPDEPPLVDQGPDVNDGANSAGPLVNSQEEAAPGEADLANAMVPGGVIPAEFHGRWGITLADCDPQRSDAKGAMIIGQKTIRFYESVASLQTPKVMTADRVEGQFTISGEGMTWAEAVALARDGDVLTRRTVEPAGQLVYRRCT